MIAQALQTLRPGAQWVLRGDEYSGLEWLDENQSCPSETEVSAEVERLIAAKPFKECKEKAKRLIAETDWSQYADVRLTLRNTDDYDQYRATLRALIITPEAEPDFPIMPEPNWV